MDEVNKIWSEDVSGRNILDVFLAKLKGWGGNLAGQIKKRKIVLREELTTLERLEEDGRWAS